MTYKANQTFYADVEIATILLALKQKDIALIKWTYFFG